MSNTRVGLRMVALVAVAGLTLTACTAAHVRAPVYPDPSRVTGDVQTHDPSMVKAANGTYYVYSTGTLVEMRTSPDRLDFTRANSALTQPLTWTSEYGTSTDLWAPDVSFHEGKYWLYYAVSSFGSNTSAIGLATSASGAPGTFTDQGKVYSSASSDDFNAIDPNLLVDSSSGKWWLAFGSFWSGIKMIQIDPATGMRLASDTTRYDLAMRAAPDAEEAAYVRQANGYYYLFVSWDTCCQGISSTYRVMVGRSKNVTGPYKDKSGKAMLSGGGSELLASHGSVHGPGGESVLHDTGGDLLIYHWYDGSPGCACKLGIDTLSYDNHGWPYVH